MAMNDDASPTTVAPTKSYKDALTRSREGSPATATTPDGNETLRRIKTRIIRREFPHLDNYLAGLIADAWIREDQENKNMCLDHKDDDRGAQQEHIPERPERCGDLQPPPSV